MLNITIPMWLLLTIAGLPNLLLVMLVFRLVRLRKRKSQPIAPQRQRLRAHERQRPAAKVGKTGFSDQVQQQILTQQIDAVFNALFTIIETERIKLKALVGNAYGQEDPIPNDSFELDSPEPEVYDDMDEETTTPPELPVQENSRPTVVSLAEDGLTPDEIALHLGLSKAEVALALKMNAARKGNVGRKMRAVA